MHLFLARLLSIAVITEAYVRQSSDVGFRRDGPSRLKPTSDEPADL